MKIFLSYIIFNCLVSCLFPGYAFAQQTNSNVSGYIRSQKGEALAGATITVSYEPTGSIYTTQSRTGGVFYFSNLIPGGPYSIKVSHTGYEELEYHNLFVDFSSSGNFYDSTDNDMVTFILNTSPIELSEVVVSAGASNKTMPGIESIITNRQIASLPSISRNLQDFIKLVPQAKVNGDGVMSLAGQNNKFNAFFIDGSNNNDILGVALSGTNGGQTNTPPVSMEVLDKINVLQAPYNVEYSNFTGGSINAITKSGSNELKSAAWYYFRNQSMAGRSPQPIENPNVPGTFTWPRLSPFFNQTYGVWVSGPLVKNKLFYFLSAENQTEYDPQPFSFSNYQGASSEQQLNALADTLRKKYNYEPGSFLEKKESLNAVRTLVKADWNPSAKNKITFSYRYNLADRVSPRPASSTSITFQNNAFKILSRTHAASAEWKSFFKNDINNRFLISYTNQVDDRQWLGQPFPQLLITDGAGMIYIGSNPTSQLSLLKANELAALDVLKFVINKNRISVGADYDFAKISDLIINPYFGNYRYGGISDFLNGQNAIRYTHTFPLSEKPKDDNTSAGAKYNTLRLGFFINDEMAINHNLTLNAGIRIDGNALPLNYAEDQFFNDTAAAIISKYYDLYGARSGSTNRTSWAVSPRVGFTYKIPDMKITVRGGAGFFSGRILNIWASDTYNNSMGSLNLSQQSFNPDPYGQPDYESLGMDPRFSKGEVTIIAKNYKYPSVFRSSLTGEKKLNHQWTIKTEFLFTKNINEWKVTNVNLLPAGRMTQAPDARLVYSINTETENIPLMDNGENPYAAIYLLSNNHSKKGFSYNATLVIDKSFKNNFFITAAYTYESSRALFEPYNNAGPVSVQWSQSETVNGKNATTLSRSDVELGHRVYLNLYKKFRYWKNRSSTSVSLFYNGQSGQPFSYVYNESIINDNGRLGNYDLIYIPTQTDLNNMIFIPATSNNGISYSPEQQKDLLNKYIEHDPYLKKHRGKFARRNGARLPFTHTIDLRIQQDFIISLNKKKTTLSIFYDVLNFANMLNKRWGRTYFLSNDNFKLIQFAGYQSIYPLVPRYHFLPVSGTPYSIQTSTEPGNSARWISQLGFKITFN